MNAVDATQVAPARRVTTAARLARAWDHAGRVPRRTTVLAITTSVLVSGFVRAEWPMRLSGALIGALLAAAALVDLHELRLPNRLLLVGAVAAFVGATACGTSVLLRAVAGALLAGLPMFVVHLRRGVGLGDVKAAAVVGAGVGSVALVAAPVAVAVSALTACAVGFVTGRARLPLGPALWFGWAVSMFSISMGWFR